MSEMSEAAFEANIPSWLVKYGGYRRAKISNAGDGLHFEPRHGHGLLRLRSGRVAPRACVPGSRLPGAVGHAPGHAARESRWSGLRARLEYVCALLRAPQWPSWCPRPCLRHGSEPAATLCWSPTRRPARAEPSRKREMVDALRASREVLEASIGVGFDADAEASQPELLDPGRGS